MMIRDMICVFGGGTVKKTTAPAKSNGGTKSTPKSTVDKISAAPNDEFDAIFGSNESK